MSDIFEIAYATVTKRLCIFTGTGFSKELTDNTAPSWQGLLESVCDKLEKKDKIISSLFPTEEKHPLSLEESAQVISSELSQIDTSIHVEVSEEIKKLELVNVSPSIKDFFEKQSLRIITTNYDKLIEKMVGNEECLSLAPGLPIPHLLARVKVFHVHGSVDSPDNMVITTDDYFKFLNNETYFSRKLSTILHENTVVILGYSLADTNLKAIISDYKSFSIKHTIGSNIFFISRSKVNQAIKDYYAKSYGIRVIDELPISDFFEQLNYQIPIAEKVCTSSIEDLRSVLENNKFYTDNYLKLENSFYEIILSISAFGKSIDEQEIVDILGKIIEKKMKFTEETGAWGQYTQLASWLIYLSRKLELTGTSIETSFLDATLKSMTTMAKKQYFGYSWQSYKLWNSQWNMITLENRALIKKYVTSKTTDPDALYICNK